jgi:hypothetical protein
MFTQSLGCLAAVLMATGIVSAFNGWLEERQKGGKVLAIGGAVAYIVVLVFFMLNH